MKRFTKGCLFTALALLAVGSVFCGMFGMLGGFRQLDSIERGGVHLGKLDAYLQKYGGRWWRWNDSGSGWSEEWQSGLNGLTSTVQTEYKASDFRELDIELGGENLVIAQSEDDYVWLANGSKNARIKYGLDGGAFKLYNAERDHFWGHITAPRGCVYLYLPKGMGLSAIDLEIGAGKVESIALEADEIDLEVGAGNVTVEGMKARTVRTDVGAGSANIGGIHADEADITAGVGSISVKGANVRDIAFEVGMGNIDFEGAIAGDADIDCGMGNIDMALDGREADYNYNLDCTMGTVRIGDDKYSGLSSERFINNGSSRQFDVDCSMGNINISFR